MNGLSAVFYVAVILPCIICKGEDEEISPQTQVTNISFETTSLTYSGAPLSTTETTQLPTTVTTTIDANDVQISKTTSTSTQLRGFTKLNVTTDGNKIVRLPEQSTVLHAEVTPHSDEYEFEWLLIKTREGIHEEVQAGENTDTLTLTNLTRGLYEFKVSVSSDGAYGQSFVNVTVLPPLRVNKPPKAVITVTDAVLTLPIDSTVLDGASSTDDDAIMKYDWQKLKGPLLESSSSEDLPNVKTLQLQYLTVGEHVYQLTVTDSDGATDSTTTTVTVKQKIDNPPIANAGPSKVITLPVDSVQLCGNDSKDDWGVKEYEWSLSPDSQNEVADMKGAREKCVTLSKLQAGQYTLQLTVTDEAGQEDTAKVTVLVKPESNHIPVANAGEDVTVLLLLGELSTTAKLDGSESTDDKGIVSQQWAFVRGPEGASLPVITVPNALTTTVTQMQTPGQYIFELTVTDVDAAIDKDQVTVTVRAERPPKANAGDDVHITLPDDYVMLNGSLSSDDHGIVAYKWSRDDNSPAAGHVCGKDTEAMLHVGGLVKGEYTFILDVTNAGGKTGSDEVKVIVAADPYLNSLLELHLVADISHFTEGHKKTLVSQLHLIMALTDDDVIHVRNVYNDLHTAHLVLLFHVSFAKSQKTASEIVNILSGKLSSDSTLLEYKVALVDTHICGNTCSGHGRCHAGLKTCECDAFWMQNFLRVAIGDGQSNCDWSVLYVAIISFILLAVISCLFWFLACFCIKRRQPIKRRYKRRYEKLPMKHVHKNGRTPRAPSLTSSDDEMKLFERKTLLSSQRRPNKPRMKKKSSPSFSSDLDSPTAAILPVSNGDQDLLM